MKWLVVVRTGPSVTAIVVPVISTRHALAPASSVRQRELARGTLSRRPIASAMLRHVSTARVRR